MTSEERARIGKKLRALRVQAGLTQAQLAAAMPKGERVSVRTIKAIETARTKYLVRDSNIELYAAFFGTSITALLREDEPRPILATNPLLQDLHDEHLEIARRYMHGRKQIRSCIEVLLDPHLAAKTLPLAGLILHLIKWQPEHLEAAVTAFEHPHLPEPMLAPILMRLAHDEKFVEVVTRFAELPVRDIPAVAPAKPASKPPRAG